MTWFWGLLRILAHPQPRRLRGADCELFVGDAEWAEKIETAQRAPKEQQ